MLGFLRGPYPGGLPTSWDLGEEFSPSSPSPSRSLLQQHRDYVAMHGGPPTFSSQLAETLSHAETQALTLGMEGLALGTADLTLGVAGLTLGTAGLTLGTADLTLGTAMLLFAAPAKGQRLWQAGEQPWEQPRCDALGTSTGSRVPRHDAGVVRSTASGLPAFSPWVGYGLRSPSVLLPPSIIFPLVLKPCGIFACSCDFP